jgi:mannose/cellobiose epimerase-like protein (N-acyl-D-glucosamine 2-epimerase family)
VSDTELANVGQHFIVGLRPTTALHQQDRQLLRDLEPGHQAEWVWLLKGFERITGCPTWRPRAELLETAALPRRKGHAVKHRPT